MAHSLAEFQVPSDAEAAGDRGRGALRRCRGRPRLTDTDRAQRRLESRKKYDIRRVYLGEAHKLWSDLRRRTSLSDAGLAEYLILLHATCGDKYLQKHSGNNTGSVESVNQRKIKKERESSLHSLVCWYQKHLRSCPHEPQLRALELQPNFSTAAIWQCDGDHSFVQQLFSPLREASDSEREERQHGDDCESAAKSVPKRLAGRRRKTNTPPKGLEESLIVSEVGDIATKALTHSASVESAANDLPLTEPQVWEMEMVLERPQGSPEAMFHSLTSEEEADDVSQDQDEGATEPLGEDEHTGCGYERVAMVTSFADKPRKADERPGESVQTSPQPELLAQPPAQAEEDGGELYDPHALQAVVTSCDIPNHQTALEGSQLIIITGPSYEALASEGIQLNMGAGNVEEVTCTVLDGVGYDQACDSASKMPAAGDDGSMAGLSDKQLLEPNVDTLELSSDRELQRSLSRSKRNRRGPVIEADGMLKMFHCPYEGCSQVYVAISSFQNHVNLVHRKGRTKVCPHPGCGKKFYLSNHLHRHMIIHSGVRDFICETCGKSFKRKNHLEVHRRTHTGETPLQCEICGYQCRQRASLNWHMKKHTPEAHYNYTCEFCDKRFEKLDSVKFHKLKSHPEKLSS
ncbi:zinc finger protein 653 isoform X2 [Nerophis lumbriciformis]|uniref:zinc finger protein 653 isoform X2 n=2 Tax=Nerophis lumbriciformis TaxID=546530 RepID=UPI002ADFBA62|nr:zinc finger protein 653-like isoform X2 [Nerophis lumbriciformis]